jgi:broad specificity phosphatase PhoE
MKTLEIRRHSLRKQGAGSQLSQQGVDYARRIGATTGPFAYVVTSVSPRARETAIAMGFAVDQEIVTLASDEGLYAELETSRWWESSQPFAALAGVMAAKGATWLHASATVTLWRDIMNTLEEGAAALVIAHSGDLEIALVACFPNADHAAWGEPFGPCEGARLLYDGDPARFSKVEILREPWREYVGTAPRQ